ncbi:MAG TPA: type IX secretion system membrane protein PorP/SprF [Bacteroidia bacterium]|jgi:type IX secretion system PorP/SprF family membrane protein
MKKTLTLIAFSITGLVSFAQQDAQFSMNMFNKLAVNPGYAGTNKALCATILYRDQWDKFPGAPKTGLLSVDFGQVAHGGLGLTVDQDQLGFDKTLKAKLAYSFHLPIGAEGTLGIGLDAGMISKSMSGNFIAPDGTSTNGGGGTDNAIPWSGTSATTYDVGFGVYYTNNKLYVGLSSLHLPQQTLSKKNGAAPVVAGTNSPSYDFTYEVARHYYVMAGYKFILNTEFDLTPSILTKSDASSTQLDFNLMARWHQMVFIGASYRLTDAIPVFAGIEWNGFKLGYAYDITLSALKSHSSGTHELMLGYCKKFTKPPVKKGHMNVRFL